MTDILIVHGTVITMDPGRRVIEDGAVAITGDRITEVGPSADLLARHKAARVIDARRKAVLPGLVDAHAHAGHGLVKTLGGGDNEAWGAACETIYTIGSDDNFWRAESLLSALERLRCGVTTGVSFFGGGDSIMRSDEPSYGQAYCDAVAEVGIRAVMAVGPSRGPFPRTYGRWDGERRTDRPVSFEQQLRTTETLIDTRHGAADGRINVAVMFPVLHDGTDIPGAGTRDEIVAHAKATRALGRAKGVGFTQDGHRRGSIKTAHEELGLLGPDAYFSHSIDLTEEEIRLCAETDTRIVHNPSAFMSIRGRCPVPELIDAGVTVAIGSDGTAPDRSYDMFRHMFQCMHYHRTHFKDSSWMPPGKVLEMITIDAARTIGLDREIGSLEAGKKADVILIDLMKPHLYPLNMPVYRVVCFANGADVDTVLVDGKVLMEGRKVATVDEPSVLEFAQSECETMLRRTGLEKLLATPEGFWGRSRY